MILTLDYDIGPVSNRESIKGQLLFAIPDSEKTNSKKHNVNFMKILHNSLKKMNIEKEKVVVGIIDIFVDQEHILEVSFFKVGSFAKSYIIEK